MGLLGEIASAADLIYRHLGPTPEYCWPLICERAGTEVWVKHENHTPIGSFKVRGGLVYLDDLIKRAPETRGVIAATRGNHGQSVAYAARRAGIEAVVVAPHGNSVEKNRAMRAFGAELIEHGEDFNAALDRAEELAAARGLHAFPSYHPLLVRGVASYGLELFHAVPDLDTVYVPIGLGSGINGVISARDALGLGTRVVGVVAEQAATYALSFDAGRPVSTETCDTLADGVSVRIPSAEALEVMLNGAERVVTVSEGEIGAAMRAYYTDTHNLAEGAGAAPLAALLKEKEVMAGRKVAVILSGGNVDSEVYRDILAGV
ncbi:MAG: threonine dehydratase [Alphaproteobacteria bacterium]